MKNRNTLILSLTIMLSACSAQDLGLLTGNEAPNWRPYKDIDQTTQYITFNEITTVYLNDHPNETRTDSVGSAYKKGVNGNENLIGYLYYIYDASGTHMTTYFATENNGNLNPHSKEDLEKLAKAKKIDFYEFGKGRLSHAQFLASKSICEDFNNKNGINIKMATNYYADNDNYYTSILTANISRLGIKNVRNTPVITGKQYFINILQKDREQNEQKLASANLEEKKTIFTNIICHP